MHLEADDLLGQIQADFPHEFELARLRLLVTRQAEEIQRLTSLTTQPATGYGVQFPDGPEVTRHDLKLP